MKTLCINSSDIMADVCLIDGNKIVNMSVKNPHSEFLLKKISELLDERKLSVEDFDNFSVVVGPGSFTGIRIAVAIIKAMAVVNKKANLLKITNFDLIKYNQKTEKNFLVVIESGNEDYYVCEYENFKPIKTFAMNYNDINKYAKQKGIKIFADKLKQEKLKNLDANFIDVENNTLGLLSSEKINIKEFVNINDLKPVYVKLSQAEKQLSEKILSEIEILPVKDVEDILLVENVSFEEKWTEETFKNEIINNNKYYFIAKVKGEVAGYIGLESNGDDLSLLKIAVIPNFRNYGIGTLLIKHSLVLMKKLNLNKLFLEVSDKNTEAKNLYNKLGFKTLNVRKNYYKNGDDCLVMMYEEN